MSKLLTGFVLTCLGGLTGAFLTSHAPSPPAPTTPTAEAVNQTAATAQPGYAVPAASAVFAAADDAAPAEVINTF
jgi:hypothetical protein